LWRKPCGPRSEASPTSTYRLYFSINASEQCYIAIGQQCIVSIG
jgi:hypothetical protein